MLRMKPSMTLHRRNKSIVCRFLLVISVEEKRGCARTPRWLKNTMRFDCIYWGHSTYSVADAPGRDSSTLRGIEAGFENSDVVIGGSTSDVKLRDGDFKASTSKSCQSSLCTSGTSSLYDRDLEQKVTNKKAFGGLHWDAFVCQRRQSIVSRRWFASQGWLFLELWRY